MQTRNPVERLTREESELLRGLIEAYGEAAASKLVGPIHVETFRKAAVGAAVARLTVLVIRARLAVMRVDAA